MASVKPAMEAPAPSATEAPAAEAAPEPRAEAPVAEPRVETQSASTQQVQSTSIDLTEPPPTFADPVLDAPELSQVSAPVAPVAAATIPPATTPSPSLELSPSPVSWSVEQALGDAVTPDPVVLASQDPSTEIDDVVYAPAEVQALAAEVHVCTAPDPTLYGGNDRVAANSIEPIAEPSISVHVQPIDADANPRAPSLIERAEARIASLAPAALDEPNAESAARKPKNKRSFFPIALFGAATGGAILLATLLSPDASNGKAAAGKPAPTIGDVPAGILEVDAKGQTVLVDGVPRGRGERVSVVLSQGSHTVGLEGHAETRQVEVRASEVVRVNGSEIFAEAKIPRTSTEQSKVNLEKLP